MNKDPRSSVFSSRSRGAFEIALLYLLIGMLWIVFSDEAAARLAPNQAVLTQPRETGVQKPQLVIELVEIL